MYNIIFLWTTSHFHLFHLIVEKRKYLTFQQDVVFAVHLDQCYSGFHHRTFERAMAIGSFILTVDYPGYNLWIAGCNFDLAAFILTFPRSRERRKHLRQTTNMKINTKQCTPIKGSSDSVMIHPNIDNGATVFPPARASADKVCDRESKYLPTIIYTLVMISKRLDSHNRLLPH